MATISGALGDFFLFETVAKLQNANIARKRIMGISSNIAAYFHHVDVFVSHLSDAADA